ncbi:MAG: hypothetical protein Q4D51_04970 [Eubacteriales bacterium]|nr:hypothetical protein [Eubacteriales bacterium]
MHNFTAEELAAIKPILEKERTLHLKVIRSLFHTLDTKFNLYGADLPVTLDYDTEIRGAYIPTSDSVIEGFSFSLLHIGYALKNSLSKEDRNELFKIEYAHYMAAHLPIPDEHKATENDPNRAWKYCYSLITTPNNTSKTKTATASVADAATELKAAVHSNLNLLREVKRAKENRTIVFNIGDQITHPKYGEGIIENITQTSNSVQLTLRFGEETKIIDQQWIIKNAR